MPKLAQLALQNLTLKCRWRLLPKSRNHYSIEDENPTLKKTKIYRPNKKKTNEKKGTLEGPIS